MNSEEIGALNLRDGDEVEIKIRGMVEDCSGRGGYTISMRDSGGIADAEIVSIERVMPGLPDGWGWCGSRHSHHAAAAKELRSGREAYLTSDGCISGCPQRHGDVVRVPAEVAKVLLAMWERRQ